MPGVLKALHEAGVEIRGDARTRELFGDAVPASESDWSEEYLAPILAVRVVDDLDAAVAHVRRYGSAHTDVIVTESYASSQAWLRRVNSSTVGRQLLDRVRGRVPARARRRDRDLDLEAARVRADGARRAHDAEVRPARRRPASRMTRIGVLGGTFNPIHLGHLRAAEEVAEALALDRVLLVPSAQPPHKAGGDALAPGALRLAWVEAACAGNPRLSACDVEIARGGASYTVDTLRALAERATPAGPCSSSAATRSPSSAPGASRSSCSRWPTSR